MSKDKLTVTGKRKPQFGNKRSHALNTSRRKWNVNLQNATIMGLTNETSLERNPNFKLL